MIFLRAAAPILRDFLSTFLFVGLFLATNNIYLATAIGVSFGIGQAVWVAWHRRPIGALQWLSLVLVTLLGVTTIIRHNPFYIMMKPTLLWLALGVVMLRRDWMAPYLPKIVTDYLDDREIVRAGYAWAALMFLLAVLNFAIAFMTTDTFQNFCGDIDPDLADYVASLVTPRFWALYALAAPWVSFPLLLGAQYVMFRKHVLERMRRREYAKDSANP